MKSDNLELVTIIESISAAGSSMPPAFVLSDGPVPDCCDLEGIGWFIVSFHGENSTLLI
jgi:hypothetical protein